MNSPSFSDSGTEKNSAFEVQQLSKEVASVTSEDETSSFQSSQSGYAVSEIYAGVMQALPIALGYLPLGFAFGVAAMQMGMTFIQALLMSFWVYGGSSQMSALGLMAVGAPVLSIVLTTFIVNLRHLLMSSSLAPYLKKLSAWKLAIFSFSLSDESFALHSNNFSKGHQPSFYRVFAINWILHSAWFLGTFLAILVKDVPEATMLQLGVDFAPMSMFIALLVLMIHRQHEIAIALLAGILAVVGQLLQLGPWSVLIGSLIAATAGLYYELRSRRQQASIQKVASQSADEVEIRS